MLTCTRGSAASRALSWASVVPRALRSYGPSFHAVHVPYGGRRRSAPSELCSVRMLRCHSGVTPFGAAEGGLASVMLEAFIPASTTRVVVCLDPISMRLGPDRLRTHCAEVVGVEPDLFTSFLFTNKKRDCLLLFSTPRSGDQTITKKLMKGAFLLPAREVDKKAFVVMKPAVLPSLFRSKG